MYRIIPAEENPALRQVAREIPAEEIAAPRTRELIAEMKALLAQEKYGVALAAPQVGEPVRLFVVSGRALLKHENEDPDRARDAGPPPPDEVYMNPVMTKISREKKEKHEGCLSIRGKWGHVPRAEKATVRALDEEGRPFTRGASGFLAHIFQHEMDHLEGILYIDKATSLEDEQSEHEE